MKSKEEEEEEEEGQKGKKRLIEKLRRRAVFVGHRSVSGQPSTPAHISFNPNNPSSSSSSKFASSSRKLAASLWEFYQYHDHLRIPPPAKMHRVTHGSAAPSNRRLRDGHGKAAIRDNGLDFTDHQPESAGSIRRQIGQMLMKQQQQQSTERKNHELEPVSPSSYGSSLEVAPYNPAVTPGSSLEFHGRRRAAGEPNYSLKTSTELLKVLNRIWSLEEQHSANISLIKTLKTELAHSRARIKELLRDQQAGRHEVDDLVKQLTEAKLSKETKERDRLNSAVQSLEDERKLRKRSESLHRKLSMELSEVKSMLSSCVKEMERGAKSTKILERLCDEFAKGIKSYERKIHGLKQKLDKNWEGWDEQDQMVLCAAESWLDERIQTGDGSVLEKLEFEIEAFLKSKQNVESDEILRNRRSSLESVPFNARSAPIQEVDSVEEEEEDSNCFELKKHDEIEAVNETEKPEIPKGEVKSGEKPRRRSQSPSSLQVKFEDQMAWAMSCNEKQKSRAIGVEPETDKSAAATAKEKNNVVGEMIRTHRRLLSGSQEIDEASCSYQSKRRDSPIRHWNPRTATTDLDVPQGAKENTLKAKLSEARTKSSRSRFRLFKG